VTCLANRRAPRRRPGAKDDTGAQADYIAVRMKLPELSPKAQPEFADADGCKAWLANVPLANVSTAQYELLTQVEEFNRFPASAAVRLAVLEQLREAVHFVQIEQAKRFTNRALPMAEAESSVFEDTKDLWEEMRTGYMRCLDAAVNGESGMRSQAALICQRALAYTGLRMFHHYRAYREVPAGAWHALHEVYAAAERLDIVDEAVKDYLNRDVHDTSPRIAWARAVLMAMSNPNELSQRQLTFVAFLLERWASKLDVSDAPVDEGEGLQPLIADLAGDVMPERADPAAVKGEKRYLDTRKLAKSLRNRVGLLRKGEPPSKLALGEDCVQPSCEQLLVFLYRHWCQPKPGRSSDRKSTQATAEVCSELAAIHYYLTGRGFRQPGASDAKELTKKQRDEIATFGRVSTKDEDDYSDAHGFSLERWHVEDESAQGVRMVRRAADPGRRYSHGQLVAFKPADARGFILGQLRWLMQGENGDLHAGLKLLPGIPMGTAARPTGLNVQVEKFVQVVSLGAVPAIQSPVTLVLPVGWYKPSRIIEVYGEQSFKVKLTELVERGTDFERVAYEKTA
jgi:cyclic-di-GMP-binding protein